VTKSKKGNTNVTEKQEKKEVPKEFIEHIVKLGFDAKDAMLLYESKDDWLGMSSGGRVFCSVRGCKFSTHLSSDALFEHCRAVHDWRDYPCEIANCQYVAFSSYSYKKHMGLFHSSYRTCGDNPYPCSQPGCKTTFRNHYDLIQHELIHNNAVNRCVFCPYVNVKYTHLIDHQRMHFNTRDYKCEVCGAKFTSKGILNTHRTKLHEAERTQCPLCDREGTRSSMVNHLNSQHKVKGVKWDAKQKRYIVPEQIQKKTELE